MPLTVDDLDTLLEWLDDETEACSLLSGESCETAMEILKIGLMLGATLAQGEPYFLEAIRQAILLDETIGRGDKRGRWVGNLKLGVPAEEYWRLMALEAPTILDDDSDGVE